MAMGYKTQKGQTETCLSPLFSQTKRLQLKPFFFSSLFSPKISLLAKTLLLSSSCRPLLFPFSAEEKPTPAPFISWLFIGPKDEPSVGARLERKETSEAPPTKLDAVSSRSRKQGAVAFFWARGAFSGHRCSGGHIP